MRGRTVLIATGATYQRLPVAGCERWDGAGIFYSCTSVHARSCRSGRAAVVGGGNSAGQAVMFLAEHTAGAALLLRGDDLARACPTTSPAGSSVIRKSRSSATLRSTPSRATARSRAFGSAMSGTGVLAISIARRYLSSSAPAQDRLAAPEYRGRFQGLHPHRGRCREIRPLAPDGPRALHRSRPHARVSSPRETSAAVRPNGSRSPSATGPWRSPAHTACSRRFDRWTSVRAR